MISACRHLDTPDGADASALHLLGLGRSEHGVQRIKHTLAISIEREWLLVFVDGDLSATWRVRLVSSALAVSKAFALE